MAHRVLMYTLTGSTELADSYLRELGLAGELELRALRHESHATPTPAELEGCEAVVGEFMPVLGGAVRDFADAGVRLVASMSIGLNHVDVAGLAARGVRVANCPGYCAQDVALHAMALMLDLKRQVTCANRRVLAGGWEPKGGYAMTRTQGQVLGLVFFGAIARAVVPIARGLGMRVLVWAPTKSAPELAAAGCEKAETLDELLRASDVVSLHCPLIPLTEGLIGARELALMKPTAFLINTARGAVVDEGALADALERGVIQGAGIDVLTDELADNSRLIHAPNCVVTPHMAYASAEADEALVRMSLDNVCDLLVRGVEPRHLVRP